LTSVTIPGGVSKINTYAFSNCSGLKSVEISNGVEVIGSNTFQGCSGLTSVSIPISVTNIDSYAFSGCSALTTLTIPNSVTNIGSYAFQNCSTINWIAIGNGVTSISSDAFKGCTSLKKVFNNSKLTITKGSTANGYVGYYADLVANNTESVDGYIFASDGNEYVLYAYIGTDTALVLPEKYKEQNYKIGDYAFKGCSGVTSVEIPNSVTGIGIAAFSDCSNLSSVTIPNSVISIGNKAFDNCSALVELHIEDGDSALSLACNNYNNSNVGEGLFFDCPLENVYLGRDIQYEASSSCGYSPFYNKTNLKSLSIGNSVTNISSYAFSACSGLTSIIIPKSVLSIGNSTFDNCTSLKEIYFEECDSILSLGYNSYKYNVNGEGLFYDCPLEYIYLGRDITYNSENTYGYSPFYNQDKLTSVEISNKVHNIGSNAFRDCSNLNTTIPNSVTIVEDYAFSGCSNLNTTIPNSVTIVEDYAFSGCSNLKSTIPNSVSNIGNYAFYDCSSLDTVILNRVATVGNYCFNGCSSLSSLVFSDELVDIGDVAFGNCVGLTTLTIPNSVKVIGSSAFKGCTSLQEIIFEDGDSILSFGNTDSYATNVFYDCPLKNIYLGRDIKYNQNSKGYDARNYEYVDYSPFYGKSTLASLTIGDKVTQINSYAFYNCSNLTSIYIPNRVKSIGSNAFKNCTSIKDLHIEDGESTLSLGSNYVKRRTNNLGSYYYVTDRTGGLFSDCPLETLHLGRNITYGNDLDYVPFRSNKLTSLTIGKNVTKIENLAFYHCTSLREIIFEDGNSLLTLGSNNSSSSNTGYGLFSNCPLERIYLGRNITYSTESKNGNSPFYGNSKLTSVTIGNTVTKIDDYAFGGCSNLKYIKIGSGVLSIGGNQSAPIKTVWLTNTAPAGKENLEGRINYVANNKYGDLTNVQVYPYLSSMFEVDGVKYVPVIPSKRTCDAIDCSDTLVDVKIDETVLYRKVAMKVEKVMPYAAYNNTLAQTLSITHKGGIGDKAFMNCSGLSSLTLGDNVTAIGNDAFQNCTALPEVTLGESVETIGNGAFMNCTALSELALCDNLTSIGKASFLGCTKLTDVVIPDQTATLGDSCFYGNVQLSNVDLGNGVKTVGQYCFDGCCMPEISIPASVTSIGDYAFNKCTSLADVIINDRKSELTLGSNGASPLFASCPLDSVYIGGKIKYNTSSDYGYSPFYRNTSLQTIVITDKEEEIYDNEFYGCTNLKNVTLGNGVKKIGNWAFSSCSNLDYFNFGRGMQSIGNEAFSDCTKLTKLISYAEVPPTCGNMALDDINKWDCTLQIPLNCLDAYLSADQWMEFFFIDDVLTKEELPDEYNLKVSAVGYATLFLDFNAEIPAGVEVYVANKVVGNRLKMERVEGVLPANTGVIVLANEGTYTFEESETTPATIETNLLKGTVVNTMITADPSYSYYVLSNVDGVVAMYLAKLTDDKFLNNANKAYLSLKKGDLNIDDNEEVDTNVAQMSRRFIFDFGNATGIDELKAGNENVKAETFDLSGRRVQNATKGIYIQNGKIMIK
jgi:hypothetical protein